jgi:hypothetical protein
MPIAGDLKPFGLLAFKRSDAKDRRAKDRRAKDRRLCGPKSISHPKCQQQKLETDT